MSRSSVEVLCRYFYDPLDRLVRAGASQRFYQQAHLVTELDDQGQHSILRHGAQPLAQQNAAGESRLLATDRAHSPLLAMSETLLQHISYTSYGHAPAQSGLSRLLGFNGECPERVTGHYLLGQGNRGFNPVLMRFNSPDPLSPFGDGGINPYAYCEGDPINFTDPSGNAARFAVLPARVFKIKTIKTSYRIKNQYSSPNSGTQKNPIVSHLTPSPSYAKPSTSRASTELITFPNHLPKESGTYLNFSRPHKTKAPYYEELKTKVNQYDQHVEKTANFKTKATNYQNTRYEELSNKTFPATNLNKKKHKKQLATAIHNIKKTSVDAHDEINAIRQ